MARLAGSRKPTRDADKKQAAAAKQTLRSKKLNQNDQEGADLLNAATGHTAPAPGTDAIAVNTADDDAPTGKRKRGRPAPANTAVERPNKRQKVTRSAPAPSSAPSTATTAPPRGQPGRPKSKAGKLSTPKLRRSARNAPQPSERPASSTSRSSFAPDASNPADEDDNENEIPPRGPKSTPQRRGRTLEEAMAADSARKRAKAQQREEQEAAASAARRLQMQQLLDREAADAADAIIAKRRAARLTAWNSIQSIRRRCEFPCRPGTANHIVTVDPRRAHLLRDTPLANVSPAATMAAKAHRAWFARPRDPIMAWNGKPWTPVEDEYLLSALRTWGTAERPWETIVWSTCEASLTPAFTEGKLGRFTCADIVDRGVFLARQTMRQDFLARRTRKDWTLVVDPRVEGNEKLDAIEWPEVDPIVDENEDEDELPAYPFHARTGRGFFADFNAKENGRPASQGGGFNKRQSAPAAILNGTGHTVRKPLAPLVSVSSAEPEDEEEDEEEDWDGEGEPVV